MRLRASFVARVRQLRFHVVHLCVVRRRIVYHSASDGKLVLVEGSHISRLTRPSEVHYIGGAHVGVPVRVLLIRRRYHHRAAVVRVVSVGQHLILGLRTEIRLGVRRQRHHELVAKLLIGIIGRVLPRSDLTGNIGTLCAGILRLLEAVLAPLIVAVLVAQLVDDETAQHGLDPRILYYVYLLVDLLIVVSVEAALPVDVHLIPSLLHRVLEQLRLLQDVEGVEVVVAHVEGLVQDLVQQVLAVEKQLLLRQLQQQLLLLLSLLVATVLDLLVAARDV